MHLPNAKRRPLQLVVIGAVWLAVALGPAQAQFRLFGLKRAPCPPPSHVPCPPSAAKPEETPPPPKPEPAPKPETPVPPAPEPQPIEPSITPAQAAAVGGETVALATPSMLGDQLGIPALAFTTAKQNPNFPPLPTNVPGGARVEGAAMVPTVRSFKIADDESPRPRDRIYVGYNYFNEVNSTVNRLFGADVHDITAHRYSLGLEKTLFDREASIGFRLPLNSLTADSSLPQLDGTSTAVGDLSIILKYTLWENPDNGNLFSAGLAITAPTGPDSFAGSGAITSFHSTELQPYAGYIVNWNNFFVHGFWALNVPTQSKDVTLMYNDVGLGYYFDRRSENNDPFITAIVPTFEVHVNTPLNHRGALDLTDLAGTPDWVTLTAGTTFELNRRATFAVALATPITGPRPYDLEVLAQFNLRFGGSGRNMIGN